MKVKKLTSHNPFVAFFRAQYRNLILKTALKLFKNRHDLPSFWTMPHDTICREILLNGFYERELLEGMVALVKNREGVVLDIGANIGNHTVFFSREFGHVYSFEPVPRNCWILRANLHLNQIRNVTLIEKGLSDTKRQLVLIHDDPQNTNNGLREVTGTDTANILDVEVGDEELRRLSVTDRVVMLKVDVEGAEAQVLQGLQQTLKRDRPVVYWEAFTKDKVDESREVLAALGYRYFYHLSTNRYRSRLMNKIANAFGRSAVLYPLDECPAFDGMNVGSFSEL